MTDYVLVSQNQPQIEHYSRQADGTWLYRLTRGLDNAVNLASIHCVLKLADVFDQVKFAEHAE